MSSPCTRPECGGETHTDPWGAPVQCSHETSQWFITEPGQQIEIVQPPQNIVILGEDQRTPLVTIHPNGELEYGPDYTPDAAAQTFWDALRRLAPVAQFYEGEEPYTTEGVVPTPAQWIWKWNRATPARRLQVAENVIRAQEAEQQCLFGDHASALEELREARGNTERVRAFCSPERNTDPLGYLRRSKDILAILDQQEQP